jgi:RNA polymerase sigma factor (TIGR02999 family)
MRRGEDGAHERLTVLVYTELRRLAASKMRGERPDHTLTPTALAHEAWLRLADSEDDFSSRAHFFGVAANAMRRILVDHARARNAVKRGGGVVIRLEDIDIAAPESDNTLMALDEALDALFKKDPRAARVVEMRYFSGLAHTEIAEVLNVDRRTVDRDWAFARAWLFDQLSP